MGEPVRPTKKQRELLDYIESFIAGHGYSPSYREIMNGLHYNSVATVALHVGNLIKRGHLRKRNHSARSLEVVQANELSPAERPDSAADVGEERHEQWLMKKINDYLEVRIDEDQDEVERLVDALRLLGLHESADKLVLQFERAE